jgi:hypothetical protein
MKAIARRGNGMRTFHFLSVSVQSQISLVLMVPASRRFVRHLTLLRIAAPLALGAAFVGLAPRAHAEAGNKLPGYTSPFSGAWDDSSKEAFAQSQQEQGELNKRMAAEIALLRRQLKETDLLLERSEPLAGVLSAVVGFGAGNYYAGNADLGHIMLGTQGGLLFLGIATSEEVSSGVVTAELIGLLALRVADTILAVMSTSSFNDEITRKSQNAQIHMTFTPPLGPSSAGTRPNGYALSLAWHF